MRNMKSVCGVIFAAAIGCSLFGNMCAVSASAEATESQASIYVVDLQRVLSESIVGKAAKNNVQAEVKKSEARLELIRKEIEKSAADLKKQAALLSATAREQKEDDLRRREREFERSLQDEREEIGKKNDAEMRKALAEIDAAIQSMSSQGTYPIIIEKDPRVVVYANQRLDITDKVIAAVDSSKL